MLKRRTFTEEFKLQVIAEAEAGVPVVELSRRYEVSRSMIYKWRHRLTKANDDPFPGKGSRSTDKAKIAELERLIGRQAIEIDFLKELNRRLKKSER